MSREIKFRAKRLDTGELIYGDLIRNSIIDPFTYIAKGIGYKVHDPEIGKPVKVYPSSVGQYTGLKDKNGVEIYEGDIVRTKKHKKYPAEDGVVSDVIFTSDGGWQVRRLGEGTITYSHGLPIEWYDAIEVIGNIYENPELLERRAA